MFSHVALILSNSCGFWANLNFFVRLFHPPQFIMIFQKFSNPFQLFRPPYYYGRESKRSRVLQEPDNFEISDSEEILDVFARGSSPIYIFFQYLFIKLCSIDILYIGINFRGDKLLQISRLISRGFDFKFISLSSMKSNFCRYF